MGFDPRLPTACPAVEQGRCCFQITRCAIWYDRCLFLGQALGTKATSVWLNVMLVVSS